MVSEGPVPKWSSVLQVFSAVRIHFLYRNSEKGKYEIDETLNILRPYGFYLSARFGAADRH
jgi:hypothetical protein